jgi:hypothetical protein
MTDNLRIPQPDNVPSEPTEETEPPLESEADPTIQHEAPEE